MATAHTRIHRELAAGRPRMGSAREGTNVGEVERWLSVVGGGLLALDALRRRSLLSLFEGGAAASLLWRGLTGHCQLYAALGVNTACHNPAASVSAGRGVKVVKAVTINRPAEELYRFWRNFENLPRFMSHLESVKLEGQRSHWVARGPAGLSASWDAEIINEQPNTLIAWRSLEGSQVSTAGSVHFSPAAAGRGTEVRVTLKYDPPAGKLGAAVARLFGEEPGQQIDEDLHRFKQLMEAGEVPTNRG